MEMVQSWLQENLGTILGVCVGVAVIEVRVPSLQLSPCSVPVGCPCCVDVLGGLREGENTVASLA